MIKAIKILENRIEVLNKEIIRVKKIADEPEMLCDYEFAMNDLGNLEFDVLGMDVDNFIDVLEKAGYEYQAQICKQQFKNQIKEM